MATASDINDRVDLAIASADAGDYVTALRHVEITKLLLASRAEQFKGDIGLRYNAQFIDSLMSLWKSRVNAQAQASRVASSCSGSPFVEAPIVYARG
jgi:hypothetical protein